MRQRDDATGNVGRTHGVAHLWQLFLFGKKIIARFSGGSILTAVRCQTVPTFDNDERCYRMARLSEMLRVMKVVTGLFGDRSSAESAYESTLKLGYDKADINLIMSDTTRDRYFSVNRPITTELGEIAAESKANTVAGSELGGPKGGTVGTLAPVVAALGVLLLLPGFGIIAAGPIAIALAAAGGVGVAGGLMGALSNWGIPADRIEQYEAGIRKGGILMSVKAHSEEDRRHIETLWKTLGGEFVHA